MQRAHIDFVQHTVHCRLGFDRMEQRGWMRGKRKWKSKKGLGAEPKSKTRKLSNVKMFYIFQKSG